MATTKTKTSNQENGAVDYDSYVDLRGKKPLTHREHILFTMSTIRTMCALLGALAQAIVLYKVYHLGGH